ncbi:hypothetical protein L1987_06453 [Smallanthus sonchifolius]|uniref:Uncharacterized protein n=1 Tax=Smallanthus sonchifolius TaxID=185202 RepID=A0ACB9JY82_9ASTR|nr:hypothetical protein L1987_06453 [Smallanthus sonchifolius]
MLFVSPLKSQSHVQREYICVHFLLLTLKTFFPRLPLRASISLSIETRRRRKKRDERERPSSPSDCRCRRSSSSSQSQDRPTFNKP